MAFSFGETQRVPHAEGLIGVNGEQMAAIGRKAERRSVMRQALLIEFERIRGQTFPSHAAQGPKREGAIVTGREQRLPVLREGQLEIPLSGRAVRLSDFLCQHPRGG
jgi:hypothetical protein